MTRHVYDRRGRLLRSVTSREPLFTELDRAELLALSVYREGLCPLCGRPIDVCTADERTGAPEFVAEYTMCRATAAIQARQRALLKSETPNPDIPAYLWAAKHRE